MIVGKRLKNNFLLKLASVIVAILIWLLVVNIADPVVDKTYTGIQVQVINGAYIESMDQTYRLEDDQQTIAVTLHGTRSKVSNRTNDIQAIADLTQIVDMESTPCMVPVSVTCSGISSENITVSPIAIQVEIEEREEKDFVIAVTTGDTAPGKGYEIGSITANPETVTVSGPKTIVDKIDRVAATVSAEGLTGDSTRKASLVIYDKNQDVMSDSEMKYLTYSIGSPDIEVTLELWKTLSGITFDVETQGKPAKGYMLSEVTTTPTEITVAGTPEALEKLKEEDLKITIPGEAVDISGADSSREIKVDLNSYLPEEIKLASNVADSIIVNATIIPLDSKQVSVSSKNIKATGLDRDLTLVYVKQEQTVTVQGSSEVLENLTEEDIVLSLDLSGKTEGEYAIPAAVSLPEGCSLVEEVEVNVRLSGTEQVVTDGE